MSNEWFGWAGNLFGLVYKVPQIVKLCRSKRAEGISTVSLGLQIVSCVMYGLHGYLNDDLPILVSGIISFVESSVVLLLCIYYNVKTIPPTGR